MLLELFTSQGCSSCPPADALLSELGAQPQVIALAYHVDYWDGLGWRDPFSAPRWSQRQSEYGRALGAGNYTPQLVIDGRTHVIGSLRPRVAAAIAQAAKHSHEPITLRAKRSARGLELNYDAGPARPDRVVRIAITESGLETVIERGENRGHTMRNDHVVRTLASPPGMAGELVVPIAPEWRGPLSAVAFLQDENTGAIYGATAVALPR